MSLKATLTPILHDAIFALTTPATLPSFNKEQRK